MHKLLLVIPTLQMGGAERIFSFIANHIDKSKFEVYLILFDGEDIAFEIDKTKLHFITLHTKSISEGVFKFIKEFKRIKPDVVLSTVTHLNIMIAGLSFFLSSKKCKFIIRESSVLSKNNAYQTHPRLFDILVKRTFRSLDAIICQSTDMAEDLITNFNIPQKIISVINNPITFSKQPLSKIEVEQPFTFITVGRLVDTKGVERLINMVSKMDFNFKYIIVGDGPEKIKLENQVKNLNMQNKIQLVGQQKEVKHFYAQADLYLNGSFYEGFPNTLIEASSFGLPIISFNVLGGINEIIDHNFNGFIVEDVREFEKAIFEAKNKKWDKESIQTDIYKRFGKDVILRKYEQLLLS